MKAKYNVSSTLTHEQLLNILSYDPITGEIYRKGKVYTAKHINKYGQIRIFGKVYYVHTLIWFYMTKTWSMKEIEHRDLNKGNNRWNNLREATTGQNRANMRVAKNNTCGIKGVCWDKSLGRWRAQISKDKKQIWLGHYDTIDEAALAYVKAAQKLYGEFARHDEADILLGTNVTKLRG